MRNTSLTDFGNSNQWDLSQPIDKAKNIETKYFCEDYEDKFISIMTIVLQRNCRRKKSWKNYALTTVSQDVELKTQTIA